MTISLALSAPATTEYRSYNLSIHHSRIKDPTYLYNSQDTLPYLYEYGTNSAQCKRNATCVPLQYDATCLGMQLPYDSTSLDLVPAYATQSLIKVNSTHDHYFFSFI